MKHTMFIAAITAAFLTSCSLLPPQERIIGTWNADKFCNGGGCTDLPNTDGPTEQIVVEFSANGDYVVKTTVNGSNTITMKGDFTLYGDDMLDLYNDNYFCTTAYAIEDFSNEVLVLRFSSLDGQGCGWHDEVHLRKL